MTAQLTPNVVIENPAARRVARTILDALGAFLVIVIAVDASTEAFDLLAFTTPILAGWSAARAVFGLTVDNPNTPRAIKWTEAERAEQYARDADAAENR